MQVSYQVTYLEDTTFLSIFSCVNVCMYVCMCTETHTYIKMKTGKYAQISILQMAP